MSQKSTVYRRCFAALRIFGQHLDLERITKGLAVEPEHTHRKGDRSAPTSQAYATDTWQIKAKVPKDKELKHHLAWIARKLSSKTFFIRQLSKKHRVDLYCSYHSNLDQGMFEIPPEVLTWCGKAGISLRVSILVQK